MLHGLFCLIKEPLHFSSINNLEQKSGLFRYHSARVVKGLPTYAFIHFAELLERILKVFDRNFNGIGTLKHFLFNFGIILIFRPGYLPGYHLIPFGTLNEPTTRASQAFTTP